MSYLHTVRYGCEGALIKPEAESTKFIEVILKFFCILSGIHFMWSMHATLISAAVTFTFALPRTDCHNACNDGPAQLCFRGPVDDSISIIIHPQLPGAPWERGGWRKRGVAEPHLRCGRVGVARASRVAEAACRQCNKITARCSSLHRDARPTTKTAPAEKNKFEAGERKREERVVAQLENRLSH